MSSKRLTCKYSVVLEKYMQKRKKKCFFLLLSSPAFLCLGWGAPHFQMALSQCQTVLNDMGKDPQAVFLHETTMHALRVENDIHPCASGHVGALEACFCFSWLSSFQIKTASMRRCPCSLWRTVFSWKTCHSGFYPDLRDDVLLHVDHI